jgi:hypothetical protein
MLAALEAPTLVGNVLLVPSVVSRPLKKAGRLA